jgi:hypothetical protein
MLLARARASRRESGSCSRIISMIWSPIVKSGLRLVIGSWKIIAISRPRMARMRFSGTRTRSTTLPSRRR